MIRSGLLSLLIACVASVALPAFAQDSGVSAYESFKRYREARLRGDLDAVGTTCREFLDLAAASSDPAESQAYADIACLWSGAGTATTADWPSLLDKAQTLTRSERFWLDWAVEGIAGAAPSRGVDAAEYLLLAADSHLWTAMTFHRGGGSDLRALEMAAANASVERALLILAAIDPSRLSEGQEKVRKEYQARALQLRSFTSITDRNRQEVALRFALAVTNGGEILNPGRLRDDVATSDGLEQFEKQCRTAVAGCKTENRLCSKGIRLCVGGTSQIVELLGGDEPGRDILSRLLTAVELARKLWQWADSPVDPDAETSRLLRAVSTDVANRFYVLMRSHERPDRGSVRRSLALLLATAPDFIGRATIHFLLLAGLENREVFESEGERSGESDAEALAVRGGHWGVGAPEWRTVCDDVSAVLSTRRPSRGSVPEINVAAFCAQGYGRLGEQERSRLFWRLHARLGEPVNERPVLEGKSEAPELNDHLSRDPIVSMLQGLDIELNSYAAVFEGHDVAEIDVALPLRDRIRSLVTYGVAASGISPFTLQKKDVRELCVVMTDEHDVCADERFVATVHKAGGLLVALGASSEALVWAAWRKLIAPESATPYLLPAAATPDASVAVRFYYETDRGERVSASEAALVVISAAPGERLFPAAQAFLLRANAWLRSSKEGADFHTEDGGWFGGFQPPDRLAPGMVAGEPLDLVVHLAPGIYELPRATGPASCRFEVEAGRPLRVRLIAGSTGYHCAASDAAGN